MLARLTTRAGKVVGGIGVVVALLVGLAVPAGAAGNEFDQESGSREIVAEAIVEGIVRRNVDSPWSDCTFRQMNVAEFVGEAIAGIIELLLFIGPDRFIEFFNAIAEGQDVTGIVDLDQLDGELAFFYDVTCPNGLLEPGGRAIWPVGDAIPQRVVDAVTQQAYDNQELPLFYAHAAPSGVDDDPLVTGVETHLWVNPDLFQPVQAVAQIPGLINVTVTATPRDPVWNAGDGSAPFTCGGPGEPWNDGDRVAECGHTYQNSTSTSPTGTFTLAVTTTWDVVSVCTNLITGAGCGSVPMPPRVLTSTRPVTVAEIQAIVTDR